MLSNPEDYSKQVLKEFIGHKDEVNCVSYAPDFSFVVTGSDDQRVRLFNVLTKECVIKLKGHEGAVKCVAVSPCSRYFASGSFDKSARIWQTANGQCLHVLHGHQKSIETVTFSPTAAYLCTGSWDRTAILWSVQSGCHIHTLRGHGSLVQSSAFSFIPHNMLNGHPVSIPGIGAQDIARRRHNIVFHATGSWDCNIRVYNLKHDHYKTIMADHQMTSRAEAEPDNVSVSELVTSGQSEQSGMARGQTDTQTDSSLPQKKDAKNAEKDEDQNLLGDDVRIFLGHTGNISSLAFSRFGMLMQTVYQTLVIQALQS